MSPHRAVESNKILNTHCLQGSASAFQSMIWVPKVFFKSQFSQVNGFHLDIMRIAWLIPDLENPQNRENSSKFRLER